MEDLNPTAQFIIVMMAHVGLWSTLWTFLDIVRPDRWKCLAWAFIGLHKDEAELKKTQEEIERLKAEQYEKKLQKILIRIACQPCMSLFKDDGIFDFDGLGIEFDREKHLRCPRCKSTAVAATFNLCEI